MMDTGTLFYICRKCKGLFPSCNLLAHDQKKCDGVVHNSNAKLFAVDAQTMRSLSTNGLMKKMPQSGPVEIVLSELLANSPNEKNSKLSKPETTITSALPNSTVKTPKREVILPTNEESFMSLKSEDCKEIFIITEQADEAEHSGTDGVITGCSTSQKSDEVKEIFVISEHTETPVTEVKDEPQETDCEPEPVPKRSQQRRPKATKDRRLTVTDAGIVYTMKTRKASKKKVVDMKIEPVGESIEPATVKEEVLDDDASASFDMEDADLENLDTPKRKPNLRKNMTTKEWKVQKAAMLVKYESYVSEKQMSEGEMLPKKWYQCPHCSFKTAKVGFFDRHLTGRHGTIAQFSCTYCTYTCIDRGRYNRHVRKHEKPFICEICADRFTCQKDLQRHSWKHTGERPYGCEFCDFKTRFKERVKIHRRKHTGEKLHCNVEGCTYTTGHESTLRMHKDVKHEQGKLQACQLCSYTTLCATSMYIHQRTHSSTKNYQCSVCSFRAATRQAVVRHLKTHTKEKDYQCDQCDFMTGHATAFRSHMMGHMGIKPFQCSGCEYKSITKQKVMRHITTRDKCQNANVLTLATDVKINLHNYRICKAEEQVDDTVDTNDDMAVQQVAEDSEAVYHIYPMEEDEEEDVNVIYETCEMDHIILESDKTIPVSELNLHDYAQKGISYEYQTIEGDAAGTQENIVITEPGADIKVDTSGVSGTQEVRRFVSDKLGELFIFATDSDTMIVETS